MVELGLMSFYVFCDDSADVLTLTLCSFVLSLEVELGLLSYWALMCINLVYIITVYNIKTFSSAAEIAGK